MRILTPTRGGEASLPNQDRAIQIAKERGGELFFLYVTDVSFLDRMASPVLVDMETEIDEMGEFLLVMAQERAQKQGLQVQTLVRRGHFAEVLEAVIQGFEIDMLILGAPAEGALTTMEYLQDLAKRLAEAFGLEAVVLDRGEVAFTVRGEAKG